MDKIFLHGLKAETLIGVYDWERQQPQTLVLDIDLVLPENAADQDDIADTIHYGEVCRLVREELAARDFRLLESLAEYLAEFLFSRYPCPALRLRITKPGILPNVRETGVEIERSRAGLKT